MSGIPSEPLKRKRNELTLKDGKKVKLKLPGMQPRIEASRTEERDAEEPPRDNPAPLHNPLHGGL